MSEQFPWLQGITDWYDETPIPDAIDTVRGWNQTGEDWAKRTAASAVAPYFAPTGDRLAGQLDAAATVGQNAANTAAAGFLSLPQLANANGVDDYVSSLRHAQENFGRQPQTPVGQMYMNTLQTASEPVEATREAMGALGEPYGPAAATAGYMTPEIIAALTGSGAMRAGQPKQMNVGDLFPNKPRIGGPAQPNPMFDVKGPTGRGGPGARQEGAVKVTGGSPDDPRYGSMKKNVLRPQEELIRKASNPEGSLISAIPQALDRMERYRPAQGNAWYKELQRQGVTPEEMSLFGLDALKGSEELTTKESLYDMFNESPAQIEAWRSSSSGTVSNELTPPDPAKINDDAAFIAEFGATLPDSRQFQTDLVDRALASAETAAESDSINSGLPAGNAEDLRTALENVADNPTETRAQSELRGEIDYHRSVLGNPGWFDDVYAPYIEVARRARSASGAIGDGDRKRKEMALGRTTIAHEDYARIPGSLTRGATRFQFPASTVGNVAQRNFNEDVEGELGEIAPLNMGEVRLPNGDWKWVRTSASGTPIRDKSGEYIEVTDRERILDRHARQNPNRVGMTGYGTIGRGPMHWERQNAAGNMLSGERPVQGVHSRPSTHPLFSKEFLTDADGDQYVETVGIAEEIQNDSVQKREKWKLPPERKGINKMFDEEQNKADVSAIEDEIAALYERTKQIGDREYLISKNPRANSDLNGLIKDRLAIQDDVSYLKSKLSAVRDEQYAGSPDLPFANSDQDWKLLGLKEKAINNIAEGNEWLMMPVPWSSARAHGDLFEGRGVSWSDSSGTFLDSHGNRMPAHAIDAIPDSVKAAAVDKANSVASEYTPQDHYDAMLPILREKVQEKADRKYTEFKPFIKYRWNWSDPDEVMYASGREYDRALRGDPDAVVMGMVDGVADSIGNFVAEAIPGYSLAELADDAVDFTVGSATPGNIDSILRTYRRAPESYKSILKERSIIPHNIRSIDSNSPHSNIMDNAFRDQKDVMEKFLLDLGFRRDEIQQYIQDIPLNMWGEREMVPAIRQEGEVNRRIQEEGGVPLFNRLPDKGVGRAARREGSIERRARNPESLLFSDED